MEPDRDEALAALDDATLRGIAYGRAETAGGVSREAAARELAYRYPPATPPAAPASATDRPDPSELDDAADDPGPWWTRTRRIAAAAGLASIGVGTLLGVAIDRVSDTLAAESLAIFDRPPTDEETAASIICPGVGGDARSEVREIATVDDVVVYAEILPIDSEIVRSDVGERVCLTARSADEQFFTPQCVPIGVFESQGIAGVLYESPFGGLNSGSGDVRTIAVEWGPRGEATATLVSTGATN